MHALLHRFVPIGASFMSATSGVPRQVCLVRCATSCAPHHVRLVMCASPCAFRHVRFVKCASSGAPRHVRLAICAMSGALRQERLVRYASSCSRLSTEAFITGRFSVAWHFPRLYTEILGGSLHHR